jgi:hypothetical protein
VSSSSAARPSAGYDAPVRHVRRLLGGFAPGFGSAEPTEPVYRFRVAAAKLPVAVLAREVMMVFGAEYLGGRQCGVASRVLGGRSGWIKFRRGISE